MNTGGCGNLEKMTEEECETKWRIPLEMHDDEELCDFVVTLFLTIVDKLRNDLE